MSEEEEMKEKPIEQVQEETIPGAAMGGDGDATPTPAAAAPSGRGITTTSYSQLPKKGLDDIFSMRIPAIHDAQHTAEKTHGHGHWKVTVLKFIHSDLVQHILMGLLMLDVVILFIELFLTGYYPPCHIIERDAISCCSSSSAENNNSTTDYLLHGLDETHAEGGGGEHHEEVGHSITDTTAHEEHFLRLLAATVGGGSGEGDHNDNHDHHHNLCIDPSVESYEFEAACDPHKWTTVHKVEEVLFVFTITILAIFLVELIIMAIALGKSFFKQFFYVLDLWIVSTSLALEIVFAALHEEYLIALTGVLLFGRVWRFVRIGHGLIEVTAEYAAKDKMVLLDYAETLEKILQENNIALPEKNKQVLQISKHLSHHSDHGGEH